MFIKDKQREKKRSSRIERIIPLSSSIGNDGSGIQTTRIPLHAYQPGMKCYGTCISLTSYGAYIDVGTECDGLLHVGQMYNSENNNDKNDKSTFINHPKLIVQPGQEILVTIRSINPERKKLHLTLLPWDIVQEQLDVELEMKAKSTADNTNDNDNNSNNSYTDRILLNDLQIDDELWGEIKRVTDFGAYIEVGAIVDGFLHYMDHPTFTYEYNQQVRYSSGTGNSRSRNTMIHPTTFMKSGDRVRVWVSDIDTIRNRIKLTAHRPSHLPGPRREV
jgi:ribosomal protein S1